MEKSKGFICYGENEEQIDMLSDKDAGKLFKALYHYFNHNEQPEGLSSTAKLLFSILARKMDSDNEKYLKKIATNRENGSKGGRPKKAKEPETAEEETEKTERFSEETEKRQLKLKLKPKLKLSHNSNELCESSAHAQFTIPSVEEVKAYCTENKIGIDADRFVDYYRGKGWKYGGDTMVDWKAVVRNWQRNNYAEPNTQIADEDDFLLQDVDVPIWTKN